MDIKKTKWSRLTLNALFFTLCAILGWYSVHTLVKWQTDTILIEGNQIAKRTEPTKYGDRFYLILDSQYGVVEILVPYTKYIAFSNEQVQRVYYSPRALSRQLGDTPELQRDYPMLKYINWYMMLWIGSTLLALFLFAGGIHISVWYDDITYLLGFGFMVFGGILNVWI